MNSIRLIGIALLIVGLILISFFDSEGVDFISGLLIGIGIGTAVFGRFSSKKQIDIKNIILTITSKY